MELSPTASAGITSNAQANSTGTADEVAGLSLVARLRYRGQRATHTLAYRLGLTHYFQGRGTDTLSNELLGSSAIDLSPELALHLAAGAVVSRTSQVGTLALVAPQASPTGSSLFLGTNAGEELVYQAAARSWRLAQLASVSRVDYLASTQPNLRPSTAVTGGARADWIPSLNSFSFEARVSDLLIGSTTGDATNPPLPAAQVWIGEALVGWRRELSLAWTAELQGGAAYLGNASGPSKIVPAGAATLAYRQVPWYATLAASRVPVPNVFAALATINDQIFLSLALPLRRDELVVVSGFAGLLYARTVDAQGDLIRAYDQRSAGARAAVRFGQLPVVGSMDYTFVDQNAGPGVGAGPILDLVRHTQMINVTGYLQWGPGTPPLLEAGRVIAL
jgi:hypothetical protein